MRIAIVTEGNRDMGMGHIYRTLTLSKELEKRGAEVCFLTKSGDNVVEKIKKEGFVAIRFDDDDKILEYLSGTGFERVIIDRLEVPEDFARQVASSSNGLIIFGNLSGANAYADTVVNIIGSGFQNGTFYDSENKTMYFRGPRYYILKDAFFKKRNLARNNKIKRILLMFGGSDPRNITTRVLKELTRGLKDISIDVVVGIGFDYMENLKEEIDAVVSDRKVEVKLYVDFEDIAELMARADLFITSPGISMFEALCVGTPTIAISQTPFHQKLFNNFFPLVQESEIGSLLEIIRRKGFIDPKSEMIRRMEIGRGKEEVINRILGG